METTGRLQPALAQIWRGPPLVLQIMALLLGGLIIAQLVTLFLTLMLPPEPPPAYRLDDIARVLTGGTAETATRRALQRREQATAPVLTGPGWLTSERSRQDLAALLGRDVEDVQLFFYTPLPFAGTAGAPPRLSAAPEPPRPIRTTARPLRPGIMLAGYQTAQAGPGGGAPSGGAVMTAPAGSMPRGAIPGRTMPGNNSSGPLPGGATDRAPAMRSPYPADSAGTVRQGGGGEVRTERTPNPMPNPLPQGGERSPPAVGTQGAPDGRMRQGSGPETRMLTIVPPTAGQLPADAARRSVPSGERATPVLPGAVLREAGAATGQRQELRAVPVRPDAVTTTTGAPTTGTLPGPQGGTILRTRPDSLATGAVGTVIGPTTGTNAGAVIVAPPTNGTRGDVIRPPVLRDSVRLPLPAPTREPERTPRPSPYPNDTGPNDTGPNDGAARGAPADVPAIVPVLPPAAVPAVESAAPAKPRATGRPATPVEQPAAPAEGPLAAVRGLFGMNRLGFGAPPPFVEGDFVAALRLEGGTWAVVQPTPEAFPTAWQKRVLLWFAISFGLVAPLGWIFARRLVRPIAGFAAAAERLGRDPAAPVLALDGPAEVGRAATAFNRMQSRLRSFVDDRTAMMGAISHDLRTPLTRLRFRLEDVPDEQREGLLAEVEEMEQMISSVLSLIRDASEPGRRETVDLRAIVEDVVEDAVMIGRDVRLERGEQAPVEVDALGMRRLFANLLENAVKYGERARVRLFTDQNDAVAEVSDEGPGLPEEELERVFQPFYRTPGARKSEIGGVGLGLAVCRSIARAHGGDVNLIRGKHGLIAQVRLPLSFLDAA